MDGPYSMKQKKNCTEFHSCARPHGSNWGFSLLDRSELLASKCSESGVGVGARGGAVGRQAHKRLQVREQGHRGAVKLMCCSVRYQIYQLLVFLGALLKGPPLTPSSVLDTLNQSCHSTDARSSRGHCLNMKCPPQAPWAWSPAGGSVWENYRTFRRWSITRGSR